MMMDSRKYVRFEESLPDPAQEHLSVRESVVVKVRGCLNGIQRGWEKVCEIMKQGVHTTVDPLLKLNYIQLWNKGTLILCVIALALDPLFFYIPMVDLTKICVELDEKMQSVACILRTIVDVLYLFHMALKLRIAFISPKDQASESDYLIKDSYVIARKYFFVDILAIFPLPQIMFLRAIPKMAGSTAKVTTESLKFIIFSQSVPRILRIYPIYKQVKPTSDFLAQSASWAGAASNLFLYMLASHAAGAFWYLISVERQDTCWHEACDRIGCVSKYLHCDEDRTVGLNSFTASMYESCPLVNADDINNSTTFDFGIFIDAVRSRVVESKIFRQKLFYCFWWGFRNLSSVGQNLKTSMFVGEIVFAIGISVLGLVLFALLIGTMNEYLQSMSLSGRKKDMSDAKLRVENMRVKRRDAELWMSKHMLPNTIKDRIRLYQEANWKLSGGVEEESLISSLPKDLRRDIKRHLCIKLLMKVPMFKQMDQQLKDAMCDRLKAVLYTENSTIIWEGEPVDEIVFIIKGWSMSETKNGEGFLISNVLKKGDFCGEELLSWALDPNSKPNQLPTSNRTVVTKTQLEGYALTADDFKSIASQFWSRLHIKQLEHAFKFHSMEWRIRGASTIQAAWRRHRHLKR